ncbi:MAG: (2Fe-2S)-binding protein [Elusimicrobia bacterium]|nr:(2Fe-2S)-binding protein [Elusimicrobiota bacterium]
MIKIKTNLNGRQRELAADDYTEPLLDVLRKNGRTGTKEGCKAGQCGACVILINNKPVNACLFPVFRAENKKITTIEGLGKPNNLGVIQQSFLEKGAVQCGYCTPGMVLSTKALLDKTPSPSENEILESLDGNLCRCTGYVKIIDAVKLASERIRNGRNK